MKSKCVMSFLLLNPISNELFFYLRLFILSYYNGAFVDQSLAFNRRRDDKAKIKTEDLEFDNEDTSMTYETITGFTHVPKPPPSVCSATSSKTENGLIR